MRVLCWLALAALPAMGGDMPANWGAAGLVPIQSSDIVLEKEEVEISVHMIRVRETFRNTTERDIMMTVAFPLPELNGADLILGYGYHIPSRERVNFVEVRVGGRVVVPKMDMRAFDEGHHDITQKILAERLPLSVLAYISHVGEDREDGILLPVTRGLDLERKGLMNAIYKPHFIPKWSNRVQFYWTQRFPARATVEIDHKYAPVSGNEPAGPAGLDRDVEGYCVGRDTMAENRQRWEKLASDSSCSFQQNQLQIILTTANHWKGPIGEFRMAVNLDSPDDLAAACAPEWKRVSPTRYEAAAKDFRPVRELDLKLFRVEKIR